MKTHTVKAVFAYGNLIMVECCGIVMRRNFSKEMILGENTEVDGSATKMVTLSITEDELSSIIAEAPETIGQQAQQAAQQQQQPRASAATTSIIASANQFSNASRILGQIFDRAENFINFAKTVDPNSPMYQVIKSSLDKIQNNFKNHGISMGDDGVKVEIGNKWNIVATPKSNDIKQGLKAITAFAK